MAKETARQCPVGVNRVGFGEPRTVSQPPNRVGPTEEAESPRRARLRAAKTNRISAHEVLARTPAILSPGHDSKSDDVCS